MIAAREATATRKLPPPRGVVKPNGCRQARAGIASHASPPNLEPCVFPAATAAVSVEAPPLCTLYRQRRVSALLLSPITALHLFCVDLAAAGPLLCIWLRRRELRRGDAAAGTVGRELAKLSVLALLLAVLLGLSLLAWHWARSDAWLEAFLAVPRSRLWFGLAEIAFSLACLAACWKGWGRITPRWQHLLAAAAALNLMYHFPPLFAAVRSASAAVPASGSWSRSEWLALVFSPGALARASHFWASSLVAAATTAAVLASRFRARSETATSVDSGQGIIKVCGRIGLTFALLQVPLGLWLLMQSGSAARDRLLFGDAFAGLMFSAALLGVLALLHHLLAMACGDSGHATVRRSLLLVALVTLSMVLAGARARESNSDRRNSVRAEQTTCGGCAGGAHRLRLRGPGRRADSESLPRAIFGRALRDSQLERKRMNARPTRLALSDRRTLLIAWDDGQTRTYAVGELREQCPCASCREKRTNPPPVAGLLTVLSSEEARPLEIQDVQPVGNYAYAIHFSDGHNTGIFTLEQLRLLGQATA